jgi:RNA polymerase sigma-70 factor (ECF subfamily)
MDQHFDFIWCQLRRLGLPDDHADDAVQQVFIVAAGKLAEITLGRERSFLFGTALRVASDMRRAAARRREVSDEHAEPLDPTPGPDELLEQRRARAALDEVLDEMSFDARVVFVLFELEEMSMAQIAQLMALPAGTVASRLRRARSEFETAVRRRHAREAYARSARPGPGPRVAEPRRPR